MGILGTGCGIPREIASLLACQRAVRRKTAADEQTRKSLVSLFQRTHPEELLNINAQYNCCNAGQTLGLTGTTASEGDVSQCGRERHQATGQHRLLELLLPLKCIPADAMGNQWEVGKAHHGHTMLWCGMPMLHVPGVLLKVMSPRLYYFRLFFKSLLQAFNNIILIT